MPIEAHELIWPNSFRVLRFTLTPPCNIRGIRKLLRAMDTLAVDDFCWVETKHSGGASTFLVEGRKKYFTLLGPAIHAALQ